MTTLSPGWRGPDLLFRNKVELKFVLSGLVWAAGKNNRDLVSLLLSRGAKVDSGDKYGTTPLIWVIISFLHQMIWTSHNTWISILGLRLQYIIHIISK